MNRSGLKLLKKKHFDNFINGQRKSQSGFTLIEILVVVIIIGVLAALVIPKFAGRTEQARLTAAKTQINSLFGSALDMYEADNGFYPTTEQGLEALRTEPSTEPVPKDWKGPYLKSAVPLDPWSKPYIYNYPGINNSSGYDLYSYGPDGQEGTEDDVTNWSTTTR